MDPIKAARRVLRVVGIASGALMAVSVVTSTALRMVIKSTEGQRVSPPPPH